MYELFIDFLNQIFWEGYAEQLATENPAQFKAEYDQFFETYSFTADEVV